MHPADKCLKRSRFNRKTLPFPICLAAMAYGHFRILRKYDIGKTAAEAERPESCLSGWAVAVWQFISVSRASRVRLGAGFTIVRHYRFKILLKRHSRMTSAAGFSRLDLLVSVAGVLLLAGWLGLNLTGERARTAKCLHNLKFLGQLTQDYANDNGGSLPPASIQQPMIAWDMQIAAYIHPNQVKSGIDPFFVCPSDHLARPRPRSYAMTAHDMTSANWPPGPGNVTGVGLSWDNDNIKQWLGNKALESVAKGNSDSLALVRLSWLPVPADTVVLTEWIDPDNNLKGIRQATVSSPEEQSAALANAAASFHHGKFNYLMADGHVESLSLLQTGTLDGSGGIWTISKEP